jgi:hypothetical protein
MVETLPHIRLGFDLLAAGFAGFAVGGTSAVIGFLQLAMWLCHGDTPNDGGTFNL